MKISKKQIRRIVEQEAKRELPISYYSDEMLMQEGLLDFLKGLFGKIVEFFKGAYDEAKGKVEDAWGDVTGQVKGVAQDILGKDTEVTSLKDLDMDNKEHQKVFYAAIAPKSIEMLKVADEKLKAAANVKDWTPKDDSDEAAEAWQKENGEAANGLWYAFGAMGATADFYAENTDMARAKELSSGYDKIAESGNPGEAAQYVAVAGNLVAQMGVKAEEAGDESGKQLNKAGNAIVSAAEALAKSIAESGKEQQQESLELRKMINHMIIQERKIIKGNSGR